MFVLLSTFAGVSGIWLNSEVAVVVSTCKTIQDKTTPYKHEHEPNINQAKCQHAPNLSQHDYGRLRY